MNIALTSKLIVSPNTEKTPSTMKTSCVSATTAATPNRNGDGARRNAHVTYTRMTMDATSTATAAFRTFCAPMTPEMESKELISTEPIAPSASRTRDSSPRLTTTPAASRSSNSKMPRRMKNVLPSAACTMASGCPEESSARLTAEAEISVS